MPHRKSALASQNVSIRRSINVHRLKRHCIMHVEDCFRRNVGWPTHEVHVVFVHMQKNIAVGFGGRSEVLNRV